MDQSLIVQIEVPVRTSGAEKVRVATGYPVAPDRILTTGHVLAADDRDPGKAIRARWFNREGAQGDWQEVRGVVWPLDGGGPGTLDASVLDCPFPQGVRGTGLLSEWPPRDDAGWRSEGFAEAGVADDGDERAVGMRGQVYAPPPDKLEFELGVADPPRGEHAWEGASGSPVFCGSLIVGVLRSRPWAFENRRLYAVPACRLLEDVAFREAVEYDARVAPLREAQRRVDVVLERADVREAIVAAMPAGALDDALAPSVSKAIVHLPVDDLLEVAARASVALRVENALESARAVADLAFDLVPRLFGAALVEQVREQRGAAGGRLVSLPVATPTVAEVVMAGVDGREIRLHVPGEHGRTPTAQMALSVRLPERGTDMQAQIDAFDSDLFDALLDPRQYRTPPAERPPEEFDRLAALANAKVKKHAAIYRRTYYYLYADADNEFERRMEARVVKELARRYPAIAFIHLTRYEDAEAEAEEFEFFLPLEELL